MAKTKIAADVAVQKSDPTKDNDLLLEVAIRLINQSGIAADRDAEVAVSQVSPVARKFVQEFGDDAPDAVRLLGPVVQNIFYNIQPVEAFFRYPRALLPALKKEFSDQPVDSVPTVETTSQSSVPPVKLTDPEVPEGDTAAVKAQGEHIEQVTGGEEIAVSSLGLSEELMNKLFEAELGTSLMVMEFDEKHGLTTILTDEERIEVLKAISAKTGIELVV